MRTFDVQAIDLSVPRAKAFDFIADPARLPSWTSAFASVAAGKAVMRTPKGELTIDLEVQASAEHGTVDWRMTFPDESVATAFSRLVDLDRNRCIMSFVLTPPPVPLEQLEGTLEAQSKTLTEELAKLKGLLEYDR